MQTVKIDLENIKRKKSKPRILYQVKISFKNEGK